MTIHSVYDNGGATCDRYTVYYGGRGSLNHTRHVVFRSCVGMSEHPFHPQGFCQHGEGVPGRHNGRRITIEQLPAECLAVVLADLENSKL